MSIAIMIGVAIGSPISPPGEYPTPQHSFLRGKIGGSYITLRGQNSPGSYSNLQGKTL